MNAIRSNQIVLSNGSGATPGSGGGFLVDQDGVGTVSNLAHYSEGSCTVELSGFAGGGVVGILGDLGANTGSRSIMQATARAASSISNIYVMPEDDETVEALLDKWGPTISITLNAVLNASLQSSTNTDSPFSRGAAAGLDTSVRFFTSGGMQQDADSYSVAVTNTPGETLDLALITRSSNLTSTHDWLKPFGVNFSLQGRVGTSS